MSRLKPWDHGFGPSSYGHDIWFVRAKSLTPPPGVPFESSFTRLKRAYSTEVTWEFADGYLLRAGISKGTYVRGWAAVRYLCLTNGFAWPEKQLRDEPFVPDPQLLTFAVAEWSRTGTVHGYTNPYEKPVAARFDHRDGFWALLSEIHTEEGIDVGELVVNR